MRLRRAVMWCRISESCIFAKFCAHDYDYKSGLSCRHIASIASARLKHSSPYMARVHEASAEANDLMQRLLDETLVTSNYARQHLHGVPALDDAEALWQGLRLAARP